MSVPKRLLQVMELARALAGNSSVVPGPLRIEIPEDLLHPVPAPVVAPLLANAAFLAPLIHALPSPFLAGVERTAREHDLWLDLSVVLPHAAAHLPPSLLERTARLHIDVPAGTGADEAAPVLAALAKPLRGSLELSVATGVEEPEALLQWVALAGTAASATKLAFVPQSEGARWTLRAAQRDLATAAHAAGIGLQLPNGFCLAPLRAPDPLDSWNILHQCLRSLLALHPEICPFPFLMLRVTSAGAFGACPVAKGPQLPRGPGAHSSDVAMGLRAAFLAGKPPPACTGCTLRVHVTESLGHEAGFVPARTCLEV